LFQAVIIVIFSPVLSIHFIKLLIRVSLFSHFHIDDEFKFSILIIINNIKIILI